MKPKAFERAHGGTERLAWTQAQPCIICGSTVGVQSVHVKGGGMGRKADAKWTIPACFTCHQGNGGMHSGQKTFEKTHNIDLHHWAQVIDARWEQHYAILHPEVKACCGNGV